MPKRLVWQALKKRQTFHRDVQTASWSTCIAQPILRSQRTAAVNHGPTTTEDMLGPVLMGRVPLGCHMSNTADNGTDITHPVHDSNLSSLLLKVSGQLLVGAGC